MRLVLAIFLGVATGTGSFAMAQESGPRQSARITLFLPPAIASESVRMNYFMIGPFGGYGGYVVAEKGRASYDIAASVNGVPAETVKIIAYLPGCEIQKLEITMANRLESRTLACKTLGTVLLQGRIVRGPVKELSGLKVEISYQADWDHEFFGIADGFVTTIPVATVTPDESGQFQVALPDFFKQSGLGAGSYQFLLRKKAGGNIVATLIPENMPRYFNGLAVGRSYAPFVVFSADTSLSTPPSSDDGAVVKK